MSSKKTDLDKFSEFFCGLGFSITTLQPFDGSHSSLTCKRKDQMLGFSFDRDGELVYSTGCKSSATAAETIDARLRTLEADNARFDERVAESIKRLSESGHITSSSGNAINVKDTSDKQAAKAEFFSGGKATGSSHGGRVDVVIGGSSPASLTNEEWINALHSGHFSVDMPKLEPDEELPHTLPPHIMRMFEDIENSRDQLAIAEILKENLGYDSYRHEAAMKGINIKLIQPLSDRIIKLERGLVEETLKHFGGES